MRISRRLILVLVFALLPASTPVCMRLAAGQPSTRPATTLPAGPARWEKEIAAFEAADRANPPPKGAIVFTGSSTIRGWKTLAEDFKGHAVINRGFGGSQIADAAHFADRIIVPYAPRTIVLRAGGNDLHAGKSPEQVFADYRALVAKLRAALPEAEIVFIGLAPVPKRWTERDANKKLNELVAAYTKEIRGLKYVETYDTTVHDDGTPRVELFVKDGVHFNSAGYKLLAERVRPVVVGR